MANPRQLRNLTFKLNSGATTAVLAIAFLLIVVAAQPAQAQYTFKVIHNFTGGEDGATPKAGVTFDKAERNLYGTAFSGGGGYGTAYRLKPSGSNWVFSPLTQLDGAGGRGNPLGGITIGSDGLPYGTTIGGGGTVFNLRPPPRACTTVLCRWTETVLYAFAGITGGDGSEPGYGDLIFDKAGKNLYGTTLYGGILGTCGGTGCGVVYELTPPGSPWTESILYAFQGPDGAYPSGLIFDSAGSLYGTTGQGGLSYGNNGGYGTVFQLTYIVGSGWTETLLYSFRNGTDGSYPIAGLIFDQSGNLYGATSDGGQGGGGTVFKLTPSNGSWTYSLIYSFTGTAGNLCGPRGTLFMDGLGNLYGTTYCDGANNAGNVWELTPSGNNWTYTDLYDSCSSPGCSDGGNPISNVVIDAKGNLYGTASTGGSQGVGVVWELVKN